MSLAFIKRLEVFTVLTDDDKIVLRRAFQNARTERPHSDVVVEGESTGGVTVMVDGLAYRYKSLSNGRRQIVSYLLPGDIVSSGAFADDVFDHGIQAITASTLSTIYAHDLAALPHHLMRALWILVARELSISREWVLNIGQRDAKARVAHLFCELYYRMLEAGLVRDSAFQFPASQQEIADSVGITNVHLNRTLQILRKAGVIAFDGRTLKVCDTAQLRKIATFDPTYLHLDRPGPGGRPNPQAASSYL